MMTKNKTTIEDKLKMKEAYVATCTINGRKPGDPPIALKGDPVEFGNGEGQIPAENKEAFISAGQVVPAQEK